MNVGTQFSGAIPMRVLLDDYYANLHIAYNSMSDAFQYRAHTGGLTQDELAQRLNVDKGLISRRLNGTENLTIKTLSFMGTAMGCRLNISFVPYEQMGSSNYFQPSAFATPMQPVNVGSSQHPATSNVAAPNVAAA